MKKFFFAFLASLLSVTLIPGAAQAAPIPSDTTIYPVICASSGRVNVYLEYGIKSITITNPSGCGVNQSFYFSNGSTSTWTYSETIGGTTTPRSFVPGAFFETGAIGSTDSFTLTLTSAISNTVTISGGGITLDVYFNTQINTLNPDPVTIGQQVTVTGSNLSFVTSLSFGGPVIFSVTTENRSATQLTFTVPSTFVDRWSGIVTVIPGTYSLRSNTSTGKTLTLIAAPIVVSISSEELAQQAARAADAQRDVEKRSARDVILTKFKSSVEIGLVIFAQAEIFGITPQNIVNVQTEIAALPELSRVDITPVIKIARKYEVEGIIASDRVASIYSDTLIEIGLIPEDSKYKAALTAAIKKLPASERSSLADIAEVIGAEMAEIQARNDLLKAVLTRIAARRAG